jgi:AraC-like DNA-binding protein
MHIGHLVLGRQTYRPKNMGAHNIAVISTMGSEHPEGRVERQGRDWFRHQVCKSETFSLVTTELCSTATDDIRYTGLEEYLVVHFWLSGKHTTVLDGFGQHEHERPEVFITSGPPDMVKMHMVQRKSEVALVGLCLLKDFFPRHLGMEIGDLPHPLREMAQSAGRTPAFCRFPMSKDLAAAARTLLAVPFEVRRNSHYSQAKCVEMMCLLISLMQAHKRAPSGFSKTFRRQEQRLHKARDLLTQRYADPLTIEQISKEVGLNRLALMSGFKQLFSMSVYDYLQRERMEKAFALLQDEGNSITRVAEAVGFKHPCNFSTAFHGYFGCTPQKARGNRLI